MQTANVVGPDTGDKAVYWRTARSQASAASRRSVTRDRCIASGGAASAELRATHLERQLASNSEFFILFSLPRPGPTIGTTRDHGTRGASRARDTQRQTVIRGRPMSRVQTATPGTGTRATFVRAPYTDKALNCIRTKTLSFARARARPLCDHGDGSSAAAERSRLSLA